MKKSDVQYIHVPKTGGSSIEKYLGKTESRACKIENLAHCSAEFVVKDARATMCTVRNPYERVVSAANQRRTKDLNSWVMEHVEGSDRNKDTADTNIVLKSTDFVL